METSRTQYKVPGEVPASVVFFVYKEGCMEVLPVVFRRHTGFCVVSTFSLGSQVSQWVDITASLSTNVLVVTVYENPVPLAVHPNQ